MHAAWMDYTSVSRSLLTFNADVTTQVVELYIIDDDIVEPSEIINLMLRSTDSAVLLNSSTSTITIDDVESKLFYIHIYASTIAAICLHSPLQWLQSDSVAQLIL